MPSLQNTIQSLAQNFASELVVALRSLSLEEILGTTESSVSRTSSSTPKKRGRPAGSKNKVTKSATLSVEAIVAELKKHKSGLRAELLRKALSVPKNTFNYHATKALAAKAIRKAGKKRSTTYFAK